jgi:hypothetical protein
MTEHWRKIMAIPKERFTRPAQRFEMLTKETHLGSYSFGADSGSEIMNLALAKAKEVTGDNKDLLNAAKENLLAPLGNAKDLVEEIARDSKSQLNKIVDFTATLPGKVGGWLSDVTGLSPSATKGIMDLLTKCRPNGSGMGYGGRPFDRSMSCNGGKVSIGQQGGGSGCNASGFGDILNKLTKGDYNATHRNTQGAMNALMSLSNFGYGVGMCGVFNALKGSDVFGSNILGNMELGKAAGGLMSAMNLSKNSSGWMDLAAGSLGLAPKLTYPSAIPDFFSNFTKPATFVESNLSSLGDMVEDAVSGVDTGWYAGDAGQFMTLGNAPVLSQDVKDVFQCKLTDNVFGENDLDIIPDSDMDFLYASGISI